MDHFRLVARIYDRVMAPPDPDRLRSLLSLPAGGTLLDVGGGTGRVAQALRGLVDEIVVLDESAGMLEQARLKGLATVQGRAEHLPFADASIARILVVDAFHHLRNQERAAAEFLRVLAPGGRIVVEEPNIEQSPVRLVALAEKLVLMRSHFYPPERVRRTFQEAGGRVNLVCEGRTFWALVTNPDEAGVEARSQGFG